ncbi:MAG: 60S ribosomal protein L29 [Amphiamblys sp. WSBS2006]|nr:MAG: 60S ribosomal protein L29 [Amphiamblys sp. WSBS2006]
MAKKKNFSAHNQKKKAHRNGIKKFKLAYDRSHKWSETTLMEENMKIERVEKRRLCDEKTKRRFDRERILYGY